MDAITIYQGDKQRLEKWCQGRDCEPEDIIETLLDRHLAELEYEYPKSAEENDGTKIDLRYERSLDERLGI